MAKATVHSTICGFEHKIEGKREGDTISILKKIFGFHETTYGSGPRSHDRHR